MAFKNKEKAKAYYKSYKENPENKARAKAKREKPEYKAHRKAYQKAYRENPENKARKKMLEKIHNSKPENIEKARQRGRSPEMKAWRKEYEQRPYRKAKKKIEKKVYANELKLEVFSHYSKTLSNTDVPCCRCCLYDDIRALTLDHIIPHAKLSASEKLMPRTSTALWQYLRLNNYPKGFQILCSNCNGMKGINDDCPHKFDKIRKYWK